MDAKSIAQNPMIGGTPAETIDNCVNALKWLMSTDVVTEQAFAGTPKEGLKYGRFLLGQCCLDALESARQTIESSRMKVAA
jgi:hypothetical protein